MSLLTDASLIVTPNAYKASKLYSVIPNTTLGDMTVSRATTATRVNSAGLIESVAINVPRLDYTLGSCPSILVEPQRTNLFLYSEQLDNVNWLYFDTTITPNVTTSPDGNTTADKVIPSAVSSAKIIYQLFTTIALQAYTATIYFKSAENTQAYIRFGGVTNSPYIIYNLSTQAIVSSSGLTSSSITSMGNGWYKVSATVITSSTVVAVTLMMLPSTGYTLGAQNLPVFTGNGTSGGFIWGAQFELGSYSTSYIPTTAATVTRNADVISKTGISSLIGQTQGTIFFDGVVNNIQNSHANILNTNKDPSTISSFTLYKMNATNTLNFDFFLGNGTFNSINLSSTNAFANATRTKVAVRYKSGDFAMYVNGTLQATSASTYTANGTKSELFLNDITTYFSYQESVSFNSVVLFPNILTNAQLMSLTTL